MSAGLETIFLKAKRAEQRGEEAEARRLLEEVLKKYPKNRTAMGGLVRLDQLRLGLGGASQAGLDAMLRFYAANDFPAVVTKGRELVERFPQAAEIWNLMGAAYIDMDDNVGAEHAFRQAIEASPGHDTAIKNLALTFRRQGKQVDAETRYKDAIRLNPSDLAAYVKLAEFYVEQNRSDDAIVLCEAALAIDPRHVPAHFWLGNVHLRARRHRKAIDCYLKALTIKADHFDSVFHMGHTLFEMGNFTGAVDVYHQATLVDPQCANAHLKFADVLRLGNMMEKSRDAFARAAQLNPESDNFKAQLLYQEAIVCDWHARHEFAAIPTETKRGDGVMPPFIALTMEDNPARQLTRSQVFAKATLTRKPSYYHFPQGQQGEKIRIGYFSADFYDHATLHLMGGLLREHDRDRFEIRIYNLGVASEIMDDRVAPHVDAVVNIRDMTDEEAVDLVRKDALDIAIDLKGYTTGTRMELFADRIAPVQIAWLGYPGSVGMDTMDYMIADSVVVPDGAEPFYSEKIIRLPGSYQSNDNQRTIGSCPNDRTALGLPAEGFVFCCFNQNAKIGPQEYDIWMRLLSQVEGSVLWLMRSNPLASTNLQKEAAARGIDLERIIFADRMSHADHLARHRHADLFLDTFVYNAHTTASDALWGGLPVLTLAGDQFAARVGASLLTAIDMPDMVTTTAEDYETRALDLARSPEKIAALKERLAANRLAAALYDTVSHTRHMEAAYAAAHQRRLQNLGPDHIRLG
ncbi:MAG TPA: tetratricopeptide repeat protein [Sphingobium sp.]